MRHGIHHSRSSRVLGIFATTAIHLAMLSFIPLGDGKRDALMPEASGMGATAGREIGEPAATLFLINLPNITASSGEAQAARSPVISERELIITVLSSDAAPAFELDTISETDNPDGVLSPQEENPAVRAQLFGRYRGQINARIERAWRRPRSSVADPREVRPPGADSESASSGQFHCQAQIAQDVRGNVREIQLANCNGTVAWQMSLVAAIQQASPLPAPPTPSVFSNTLTLSFDAQPFGEGAREDGFETEGEMLARLSMR
jgi:hypothetical protein